VHSVITEALLPDPIFNYDEIIKTDLPNTQYMIHKEKSSKMQQCIKLLLFHIYTKLNMFRATHRPSSGA